MGILVAATFRNNRLPQPGSHFIASKDPHLRFFTIAEHAANLIGLQFTSSNILNLERIESTAHSGSLLKPTIRGVPPITQHAGNRGLVHAFHAHRGCRVEGGAPMLQTIIDGPASRAESAATTTAKKATPPTKTSRVKTVTDHALHISLRFGQTIPAGTLQ
jgi:hypothetical protein